MSQNVLAVLGTISVLTEIGGLIPYFRDILHHKTKPERATWWIWLGLNAIALSAQWAAGARWSLLLTAGQLVATLTIAVLSLRFGYGTFRPRDLICIIIAMVGILLWKFTNDPLLALLLVVFVDLLGFWLTIVKTWQAPHTETLVSWVLAVVAGITGTFAVGELSFTKLLYPVYIMLGNTLLVAIIIYRRRVVEA